MSTSALRVATRHAGVPLALIAIGLVANTNLYWLYLATSGVIAYVLTAALNLSYGYAGIFNMSIVMIYGLGAFISVYAEVHLHMNFWLTIPFAVLICALTSVIIALPARRLNELFLAIETLAFALALGELLKNWDEFSGGTVGVYAVPVPSFFNVELLGGRLPYYWLCAIGAWIAFEIMIRVKQSGLGRQFVALREGPRVLGAVGASPGSVGIAAFAISGALAGLGGVLLARFHLFISLDAFGFERITTLLLATILGGAGKLWGPFFGVVALVAMDELSIATGQDNNLIFGVAILALVVIGHGGVAGGVESLYHAVRNRVLGRAVVRSAVAAISKATVFEQDEAQSEERVGGQLTVTNVGVAFGGTVAVNGVTMHVTAPEVVGLIGPNGAGKTSLVNAISGDVRATGSIKLNDVELVGMRQEDVVRLGVGRTFQSPQIVPELTLVENLMLAHDSRDKVGFVRQTFHTRLARTREATARAQALELLRDFDLADRADQLAHEQTYGVLRIVEVARNLMLDPKFLLLDEPGAGLTEAEREELAAHIQQLRARGIGVLLIDHNMPLILAACDRVFVMDAGQVIAEGTPNDVLSDVQVISAYLGVPG
jgi:branched-chain amino acid transport system permease protein